MGNIGFRVYSKIDRPDRALVEEFRDLSVANIADNMNRFFCVHYSIKGFNKSKLLGTAFTVRTRTADNLLFHKGLEMAKPGDVMVVETRGDEGSAVTGEIMVRYAMKKGIAGFLIDGLIRDSGTISTLDFPVFAKGASPMGPYKDGPGEINVPVCCGGVVINPGDILVGDEDGVVVIKPKDAMEVLEKTRATVEKERGTLKAIEDGTVDRRWVEQLIKVRGCEIID